MSGLRYLAADPPNVATLTDIHALLRDRFGHPAFRGVQQAVIESVLAGKDTLALLPTGGGKSLCYQIPALVLPGLCLVITPLIALMKDQARQLQKRRLPVLVIHSGMTFFEVKKTLQAATSGQYKFLFVSPERLQSPLFLEYLPAIPISLLAVDEAHCISQWGYDFRPAYLAIGALRSELRAGVPVVALTASATQEVVADIMQRLQFEQPTVFRQSFERSNLSFSVFEDTDKLPRLLRVFQRMTGSGLLYCRNRRRTAELAQWMQGQGLAAGYYHAGLSNEQRSARQDAWLRNELQVMACTNAFGMGIDKPDVRAVVHADLPESLEHYYQEAGRAGRDGQKAYAVLLYHQGDLQRLQALPDEKYPEPALMRQVYTSLCHHLQVPYETGGGSYFSFDFDSFCRAFKVAPALALACFGGLQQAGYLSFSESVYLRSRVSFTASRQELDAAEQQHRWLEPLIKALLRTYEGIVNHEVSISEGQLAALLHKPEDLVVQQLQRLHALGLLQYQPRKSEPQIYFMTNRPQHDELQINSRQWAALKAACTRRVDQMLAYVQNTTECRSTVIRRYFGDTGAQPCGICDICLQQKKPPTTPGTFTDWCRRLPALVQQGLDVDSMRRQLGCRETELHQVLSHLMGEGVIGYDGQGRLVVL